MWRSETSLGGAFTSDPLYSKEGLPAYDDFALLRIKIVL